MTYLGEDPWKIFYTCSLILNFEENFMFKK